MMNQRSTDDGMPGRDLQERAKQGRLCGLVGICSNVLLFVMKLAAGYLSGSISIMADAWNNLSDAAASAATLFGFQLSAKGADEEHPFGHGRSEYIAGLVISFFIVLVGFELLKSSFDRIMNPEAVEFSLFTGIILVLSILIKLFQMWFYRIQGRKIQSTTLMAASNDAMSDVLSTSVVLIGGVIGLLSSVNLDGWLGLLVAVFILRTGYISLKDTLNPLLGTKPDEALVNEVEETVLAHSEVLGMHDLVIHDYGPGRSMMTLHAEVDRRMDVMHIHDMLDGIERELGERFHTTAVIHMDPVIVDNPAFDALKEQVERIVKEFDPLFSIHDFRIMTGGRNTKLLFDLAVPYKEKRSNRELAALVEDKIMAYSGDFYVLIQVDRV